MNLITRTLHEAVAMGVPMVFSVHHTGTVFLLDLLQWHGSIRRLVEAGRFGMGGVPAAVSGDLIHLHLVGHAADSRRPLDVPWEDLKAIAELGRVLVPLRDPMLAMLSREKRLPGGDHRFIVDGFRAIAGLTLPGPARWIPVDLLQDAEPDVRLHALTLLVASIDLPFEPFLNRIAREWTPKNTWGNAHGERLARLYSIGDLEGLRAAFPLNYDHLLDHASELIPFLRDRGYSGLRWWDDPRAR